MGLSQKALAKQTGLSQGYVSDLETGKRLQVSIGIGRRLADALKVSLNHLLETEEQAIRRVGRTEIWLYEMREQDGWSYERYCREGREGRRLAQSWDVSTSTIYRLGGRLPLAGDLIFLFFVPTEGGQLALCGLGVISEFTAQRQLRFRALPPTETLQQAPRSGPKIQRLVEGGRAAPTMWRVTRSSHVKALFAELHDELTHRWIGDWRRRGPAAAHTRRIEGAAAPR